MDPDPLVDDAGERRGLRPDEERERELRLLGLGRLDTFRPRQFTWAVAAAGLPESTTPYTLRHSGLSWALAAGIPATDVARFGGTSLAMLERTYAHLLTSSAESARARLDAFAADQRQGELSDICNLRYVEPPMVGQRIPGHGTATPGG